MNKIRLGFEKTGKAKYISHLDLMRTFQRTFMRSGIKVRQTEGFNPHVYLSIALPLPLGCESICEILDAELLEGQSLSEIPDMLNPLLPEGIRIISAFPPVKKAGEIKYQRISLELEYDGGNAEDRAAELSVFLSRSRITVFKRSKRRENEINLSEQLKSFEVTVLSGEMLRLDAVVSAQNPTVNPGIIIDALSQHKISPAPSFYRAVRLAVFDTNMSVFT